MVFMINPIDSFTLNVTFMHRGFVTNYMIVYYAVLEYARHFKRYPKARQAL